MTQILSSAYRPENPGSPVNAMPSRREVAPPGLGAERLADPHNGVPLRSLVAILRRRSRLIAWIVGCGAIAATALAFVLPARYTAKAQIVVEDPRAAHTDERIAAKAQGPDQATIQTQVTALTSHDLLARVLAQLATEPTSRAIQGRAAGSLPDLSVAANESRALERLERHLHVYQEMGSHVVSVAYTSTDPAEAAAIANKITDYYLAAGEDQSRLATNQAVSVLAGKIADLRAESEARESAVAAYQAAHGMNDAYKTNVIDQKLGDLNHQLSAAQAEVAARRARHAELSALRGADGGWERLLAGLDEQGLLDLHGQLTATLAGRQEGIVVTPHPGSGIGAGRGAPVPLYEKVGRELNQALLKLSNDEHVASAQVAAIGQRLSAVQRASDDVQLHDLVAAAESAHQRYTRLVQRRNELLEQADDVTAPARLLSWAAIPHRPSSLSPLLLAAPALVALLAIGCLMALLRERLDQGIYDSSDIDAAGVRCAGLVPWSPGIAPSANTGYRNAQATTAFAEALRGVLVSLQLVALRGRRPQVILITSSVPGEGKTTLARGLAACAAGAGAHVLLLDPTERAEDAIAVPTARTPHAGPAVRASGELPGAGTGAGLDYLPIHRAMTPEASQLMSIEHMSRLLQSHRSAYDLIFIDGASVLTRADVRLLAALSDQIVLAVRWRRTRRVDVHAALSLLRDCGPNETQTAATISAAITQVDGPRRSDRSAVKAS